LKDEISSNPNNKMLSRVYKKLNGEDVNPINLEERRELANIFVDKLYGLRGGKGLEMKQQMQLAILIRETPQFHIMRSMNLVSRFLDITCNMCMYINTGET
jgi:hypothetical protein